MSTKPSCPEGRQHINISNYAYSIIRNDSLSFLGTLNYSGFINRIVANSMADSFDDLVYDEEERISNELIHYSKLGRKTHLTEDDHQTISKIAIAHRNHQLAPDTDYPKEVTLKIRLNKELHDRLYPPEWTGSQFGLSQGNYIKHLVEDYARKTIFDRESIFFKEQLEDLSNIINAEDGSKKRIILTLFSGNRFVIKPYAISKDYEADYHYIIGMAAKDDSKDYNPSSFRISRIKDYSTRSISTGSGRLTDKEKKEIERKIKQNGISYLVGEPVEHIIRLTPVGMNMYNSIFHQRPIYNSIQKNDDGSSTLTFIATERQITNYFFAFANEAEILSPKETREWMRDRYKSAFTCYKTNSQ